MSKKKLRPLGDIMLDMEPLLMEMTHSQELQWHEVLNLVKGYLEVHCPEGREEYVGGGSPVFYYGPAEGLNSKKPTKKKAKKRK